MNYFSVGSRIFSKALTPSETMVYCALSSIRNPLWFAVCSIASISRRTGLSERTVIRALEGLQGKQLVLKKDTTMTEHGLQTATGSCLWAAVNSKFPVRYLNANWMRQALWYICSCSRPQTISPAEHTRA